MEVFSNQQAIALNKETRHWSGWVEECDVLTRILTSTQHRFDDKMPSIQQDGGAPLLDRSNYDRCFVDRRIPTVTDRDFRSGLMVANLFPHF